MQDQEALTSRQRKILKRIYEIVSQSVVQKTIMTESVHKYIQLKMQNEQNSNTIFIRDFNDTFITLNAK